MKRFKHDFVRGMNSEYSLRKFFGGTEEERQKALSEQAAAAAESKL